MGDRLARFYLYPCRKIKPSTPALLAATQPPCRAWSTRDSVSICHPAAAAGPPLDDSSFLPLIERAVLSAFPMTNEPVTPQPQHGPSAGGAGSSATDPG